MSTELTAGTKVGTSDGRGPRTVILLVHGRGHKPAPGDLLDVSREALLAGFRRDTPELLPLVEETHIDLAWYGDLAADVLADHGHRYDEALDLRDRQLALDALKQISERKRFGIRQYDCLPGKSALGEFFADTALPLLRPLGLWDWLCRRHAPDFAAYLSGTDPFADRVRDRLREPLAGVLGAGDRVALVTHGTGSVVAWDVLRELAESGPAAKVDLWVTLGSPLGDARVQRYLHGSRRDAARYPDNVVQWCNLSAEDDYTCHDKSLADDYQRMLDNKLLSAITDYRIYNHAVRFGRSNPHSSVGYYIHPRLTRILGDWLIAS